MYKTRVPFPLLMATLFYLSAQVDVDEVRLPFGPKMCVQWCQRLRACNSPVYVMHDLSCHVDTPPSTGMDKLSVNKTLLPGCSLQLKTIRTRNSRLVTVPGGTKTNIKTSMFLLHNFNLYVYGPSEQSWRHLQLRHKPWLIADGGTPSRLYFLTSNGIHYDITSYSVSNPTQPTMVLAQGRLQGSNNIAVDDGAGLIFVVSMMKMADERQCELDVFKNQKILRTIFLDMILIGKVDIDRVHRKLYIPFTWGSRTYMGEVDYKGRVCNKIRVQGQYPVLPAYDERDDVLYALVPDEGSMYLYTFNFTSGLKHVEKEISKTLRPNVLLVSCHSLVLIGATEGVIFERKPKGKVTTIAGRNALVGVIFEHSGHEATAP